MFVARCGLLGKRRYGLVFTKKAKKARLFIIGFFMCYVVICDVAAFNFTPTEVEFVRWPHYCQAMYAHLDVAKRNGFWKRVPKSEADTWFKIGDRNGGAWHYCAGITHLDRAMAAASSAKRERLYRGAIADVMFSYDRTEVSSPWWAMYSVAIARAYRGLKEYDTAIRFLEEVIKHHPQRINAYTLLGLIYKDKKDIVAAKKIFLQGNEIADEKSSEILYMLGLLSIDIGEVDEAKKYADQAAKLGYPLTGLDRKIKKFEASKK